jgi:hypothetical protein
MAISFDVFRAMAVQIVFLDVVTAFKSCRRFKMPEFSAPPPPEENFLGPEARIGAVSRSISSHKSSTGSL